MEYQPPADELRSIHSRNRIKLRLVNPTNRCVDVIWINYTGGFFKYHSLETKQFIDIDTYETHPWIAVDSVTKDRLLINGEFVYMPRPWRRHYQNINPRVLITVTIPLYSLRYKMLLEVRSYLKCESDVDSLSLPLELKKHLKLLLREREGFCVD